MTSRALALLVGLFVLTSGVARAQPTHLDVNDAMRGHGEPPQVFVLTFGEGVQIFEKFGHGAVCLYYPTAPVWDLAPPVAAALQPMADKAGVPVGALATITCFNYGVTNFREGAIMIWHFLRTQQKFWVDTESMAEMILFYSGKTPLGHQLQEDRDVWLQKLPLSADQARKIEAKLYFDIQEQNRYYYYDHFFDNCTTRLRDMIDDASGGKLRTGGDAEYPRTFRQIGYAGVAEIPEIVGISDFFAGRQLDDHPTVWQSMFHPDLLRGQITDKLGVQPIALYTRTGPPFTQTTTWWFMFFPIAALLTLPLALARLRPWGRRATTAAVAFSTLWPGLLGLAIWVLVIISSIPGLRWNENVFVLVPFDLVLPFLGPAKRRTYARVRIAILVLASALDAIGVFHQPLWIPILTAFMPLALLAFDLPFGSRRDPATAVAAS